MVTTNIVIINKLRHNGNAFFFAIMALAAVALIVGHVVYNHPSSPRAYRSRVAMNAAIGKNIMVYDTNPADLKKRVVQVLVNNTMDLNMLNNVMNHVLNKVDSDMQNGGILHGLIVERSIGRITGPDFTLKLGEYIKQVANSLNIPLMNRDHGRGSFVRRYMRGGGGSGGAGYGTLYGKAKNFYSERPGGIAAYGF